MNDTNDFTERDKAAEVLIRHLEETCAEKFELPIENDNGCYRVTVIKTL